MDNLPPPDADPLLDRLKESYAVLLARKDELAEGFKNTEAKVTDENFDRITAFTKQVKTAGAEAKKAHKIEKDDFLQAGRKVDTFFFDIAKKMEGIADKLQERLDAYLIAKADEERRRRQEEARILREAAEAAEAEARRLREEEDRKAREAAEAEASRIAALTPKVDPTEALAAQRAAAEAAEEAERQRIAREAEALQTAARARQEAEEAQRRADARPADLARTRGALGGTATLVTKIECEILDRMAAVKALHRYFDEEAMAKAARALLRDHSAEIKDDLRQGRQTFEGLRFYETSVARVA